MRSSTRMMGRTSSRALCALCIGVLVAGCKGKESVEAPAKGEGVAAEKAAAEKAAAEKAAAEKAAAEKAAAEKAAAEKAAQRTGRPTHMPCLVTERSGTNISGVYNLYYDESGRLTKAARQQTLTDCPALDEKCRKFLGSENMATTYSYDDQGRLNQVTQNFDAGRKGVLQLKYDTGGRLTGYEFKEGLENGKENSHTGTVKYGADGRVAGLSERGKVFIGGMQDASEDYTVVAAPQDGPYAGSAIVWPFGINTPYLGWRVARRVTAVTGKYGGRRTTTEKYGFDRNGNIIVFTMDSGGAWGFSYDCSE